jgi:murein tripeptide amidase MpaA
MIRKALAARSCAGFLGLIAMLGGCGIAIAAPPPASMPAKASRDSARTPAEANAASGSLGPSSANGAAKGGASTPPSAAGSAQHAQPAAALAASPGAPLNSTRGMPKPEDVPIYWRTRAERTNYHVTPDYDETLRYLRQLEGDSQWIKLTTYGKSEQGRDLPLVIVSKDRAFTPEAARATGKPIVLIQNGIHSGEIEGKDACLALIRDMAALRTRPELLDHVILLILPIFSVDAHERRSAFNRINQNGPDEMGWRFTPTGHNLNRDYLKAETPEMRALLSQVFTKWWPHLLVDDHTTDGADYRHDVTYGINFGIGVPAPVDRWVTQAFEGRVIPQLAAMGHLPAPYLTFKRGGDPASGVDFNNSEPRFSNGYPPLQCRPAILVETHMLKPYESRVRSTYDLLVALLEEINAHPAELTNAVASSESLVIAEARATSPLSRRVVMSTVVTANATPFAFKGVERRMENSDIAGAPVPRFGTAPRDTVIPLYRDLAPALVVTMPAGYLVPQEWSIVKEKLDLHGVRYRKFARAWRDSVEVARIVEWSEAKATFEGHHPLSITKLNLERQLRAFRPGDLWVPSDQRAVLVAMHLLEAQAPDGLAYWNAFDTVLEAKEYAENYVMEPIARRMMAEQPELEKEFRARVASDTAFANSPAARLDFFYRRSKWGDPEQNLLPVARAIHAPPDAVLAP